MRTLVFIYDQSGTLSQLQLLVQQADSLVEFNIRWIDVRRTELRVINEQLLALKQESVELVAICGTSLNAERWEELWGFLWKTGISTMCFVDSWQNVRERFVLGERLLQFNQRILCIDSHVKRMCYELGFSESQLLVIGQPSLTCLYCDREKKGRVQIGLEKESMPLYISEPLPAFGEEYQSDKLTSLQEESFKKTINWAQKNNFGSLRVKLHPRESELHMDQYRRIVGKEFDINIENSSREELFADCGVCLGMTSMLLLELYIAGWRSVSWVRDDWPCDKSFMEYYSLNMGCEAVDERLDDVLRYELEDAGLINKDFRVTFANIVTARQELS